MLINVLLIVSAIQYYRRALQLVPDIESRIEEFNPTPSRRGAVFNHSIYPFTTIVHFLQLKNGSKSKHVYPTIYLLVSEEKTSLIQN